MHSDYQLHNNNNNKKKKKKKKQKNNSSSIRDNKVPYSIIIPLQHDTKLAIYEEHNIQQESYMLEIPINQMYIGRYDCIHGGAGYNKPNTRIHVYVVPTCYNKKGKVDIQMSVKPWKKSNTVYFVDIPIPRDKTLHGKYKNYHDGRSQSAYKTHNKRKLKKVINKNKVKAMHEAHEARHKKARQES
jgi:hypothetical protein